MSVSGLKKYQIKPLFQSHFHLGSRQLESRRVWKHGWAFSTTVVALHAFYPGKRPAKQVQRVNDKGGSGESTHSGSTLIAAIAKYILLPVCWCPLYLPSLQYFLQCQGRQRLTPHHPTWGMQRPGNPRGWEGVFCSSTVGSWVRPALTTKWPGLKPSADVENESKKWLHLLKN